MKSPKIFLCFFIILILNTLTAEHAFAHGESNDHKSGANSNKPTKTQVKLASIHADLSDLSSSDLKTLQEHLHSLASFLALEKKEIQDAKHLEEAHEAFEGEDDSEVKVTKTSEKALNFFRDWIQNYNFKRIFYSVNRYYFLDKNIPVRQSLKDLVTLFCISHGTEVAYGVASVAVSFLNGYSTQVVLANAVIGLVIAMPGSDPLCWVILGTYAASLKFKVLRPYKYAVRYLRLGISRFLKSAYSVTGLQRLAKVFVTKFSAQQLLAERISSLDIENKEISIYDDDRSEAYTLEVSQNNQIELKVNFRNNLDGSLAVVSVESVLQQDKIPVQNHTILKNISRNLNSAIEDGFSFEDTAKLPFFIKNITKESGKVTFEMAPGALRLKPKNSFRSKKCNQSF